MKPVIAFFILMCAFSCAQKNKPDQLKGAAHWQQSRPERAEIKAGWKTRYSYKSGSISYKILAAGANIKVAVSDGLDSYTGSVRSQEGEGDEGCRLLVRLVAEAHNTAGLPPEVQDSVDRLICREPENPHN